MTIQIDAFWTDGILESSITDEEDNKRCDDAVGGTLQEDHLVEEQIDQPRSVEKRETDGEDIVDVLIEDSESEDRHRSVEDVVERDESRVEECLFVVYDEV